MSVHTRVLERRRAVAEDQAKQSLGRLLWLLVMAAPLAGIAWLAFSPWLSVSAVAVEGVETASVFEVLTEHEVVVGSPMILLDPGAVEATLETDPWIADATVRLLWPNRVLVSVSEREPLAWVQTSDGWSRRARDGVGLPSPEVPDDKLPSILVPHLGPEEAVTSKGLAGALEWVDTLPARLRNGSVVSLVDDELWAEVAGHTVRLGRPVEMTAKAKTLTALLAEGLPAGAAINLVAPTHPAVSPAQPVVGDEGP